MVQERSPKPTQAAFTRRGSRRWANCYLSPFDLLGWVSVSGNNFEANINELRDMPSCRDLKFHSPCSVFQKPGKLMVGRFNQCRWGKRAYIREMYEIGRPLSDVGQDLAAWVPAKSYRRRHTCRTRWSGDRGHHNCALI